jgi:hypothetical protein
MKNSQKSYELYKKYENIIKNGGCVRCGKPSRGSPRLLYKSWSTLGIKGEVKFTFCKECSKTIGILSTTLPNVWTFENIKEFKKVLGNYWTKIYIEIVEAVEYIYK